MKKTASLMLLAALACTLSSAWAFPDRPVTIVVPFAPGGSSDSVARIVAQALGEKWKQTVLVENRPGGNTMIGTSYVARAPADGYTLFYTSYAWSTNPFLVKNMTYKVDDLKPVTLLGIYPLALYVRGDLPADTLPEWVAYLKKENKPAVIGTAGVGASTHLAALDMQDATGIAMTSVPYKSGTIAAINDVMGGQIDGVFEGRLFKQYADSKRMKVLFIGLPQREANWNDVPSATDAGYPSLDMAAYFGLMAPAKTPDAVRQQISADVADVMKNPAVNQKLLDLGLLPQPGTPAQFATFLHDLHVKLGALIERHRSQLQE
jgi:tripartite-type tricarboxylate transporter receptor subunit TctC